MDFLIDTHVLIWAVEGSTRLSQTARATIADMDNRLYASGATAWEFADLRQRGRLPSLARFDAVVDLLSLKVLGIPADLWQQAEALPNLHGDPMDRMLVAHARQLDMTLITGDVTIQSYPVRTLW